MASFSIQAVENKMALPADIIKVLSTHDDKHACAVISIDQSYIDTFVKSGSKTITVVFTIDISGSMNDVLPNSNVSKLSEVKIAVLEILGFLLTLAENGHDINIVVVTFNDIATIVVSSQNLLADSSSVIQQIESLVAHGGTNIGDGIEKTENILATIPDTRDSIVFVLTDGFTNAGLSADQIIQKFSTSEKKHLYYGVGLGGTTNYDGTMMSGLFGSQFSGCPLATDASGVMISTTVIGTSTIFNDMAISFSEAIMHKYSISSVITCDPDTNTWKIGNFGISNKLPFCFKLIDSDQVQNQVHSQIIATISGKYNISGTSSNVQFDICLSTAESSTFELEHNTNCKVFIDYFSFKQEFTNIVADSSNVILQKTLCDNLIDRVTTSLSTIPTDHIMGSFYVDLCDNMKSFATEIGYINVTDLDDENMELFFRAGKRRLDFMTSMESQRSDTLGLCRQISSQTSSTASKKISAAIRQQSMSNPVRTHEFQSFKTNKLHRQSSCPVPSSQSMLSVQSASRILPDFATVGAPNITTTVSRSSQSLIDSTHINPNSTFSLPPPKLIRSNIHNMSDVCNEHSAVDSSINSGDTNSVSKSIRLARSMLETNAVKATQIVEIATCQICFSQPINMIAIPCKHAYCIECFISIGKNNDKFCPFCRSEVSVGSKIKVTKSKCLKCNSVMPCVLYLPCDHISLCAKCSSGVSECPECNCAITKKILVYV